MLNKQKRAEYIFEILNKKYKNAQCALNHKNPLELLISVLLSAQSTDKAVNKITPLLFERIKSTKDLANISQNDLEKIIQSLGLFRQKAKNLRKIGAILTEKHHGQVPETMQELTSLPGIARKSANIILETGFGIIEGIAVDTHVKRISLRLSLTKNEKPDKIEHDLMKIFPKKHWGRINHLFVHHGRELCIAKNPQCHICPLLPYCDYGKNRI